MRRAERAMDARVGREIIEDSTVIHLASTRPDGSPLLRALHGVVVDLPDGGWAVAWHAADEGEKLACVGRAAVLQAEELVVTIPSWFTTKERACPATSWYRSAQLSGIVEPVDDLPTRARVLQALMTRLQPEGRYRPISAEDPMYTRAVQHLSVAWVRATSVSAKVSLGQDKPEETRQTVLRALWDRGTPQDLRALRMSLAYRPASWPSWLCAAGIELDPDVSADEALPLLADQPWNRHRTPEALRTAWEASNAKVGARVDGELVATGRAVSDRDKSAYIGDVCVADRWQRRGVGTAIMALLEDHAAVRDVDAIMLRTRTAAALYRRLGYVDVGEEKGGPLWMVKRR